MSYETETFSYQEMDGYCRTIKRFVKGLRLVFSGSERMSGFEVSTDNEINGLTLPAAYGVYHLHTGEWEVYISG